ncbi:hypothetical protein INS49_014306 [Diaporthe citri]|uniref:uncharacterized protein n=1 Tax=Diaporthe citri TaxID=83186 RepID=UPI001C818D4F|nr:uncharacterized protein INS49_014306 [Diaporthe citri]KAG6358422.1 hypothetical protein INS49_014306 [Diaporthe citri]
MSSFLLHAERSEDEDSPAIHYGVIASANQLMRDALIRDGLSAEEDILCFEMEAAGLMNHFPCLVIRGVCDYADTHKNSVWQGYAAMAAAAYANDLLGTITPNKIEAERRLSEVLAIVVNERVEDVYALAKVTNTGIAGLQADSHAERIRTWLSPPDPSETQN